MKRLVLHHRLPLSALLVVALTLAISSVSVVAEIKAACAHDLSGRCGPIAGSFSYQEDFPGEGVAAEKQHGEVGGHLPERSDDVNLVGKVAMQAREAGLTGRIADVAAHKTHAYLTAFRDPSCTRGGVHVVDISNPAKPKERVGSFIPTSRGSYAGEGIKIRSIDNAHFKGDLLAFQNETCGTPKTKQATGGISLWDVTDPRNPKMLSQHQGDFTNPQGGLDPVPNDVHSFDIWTNEATQRTYAALVDNEEWTDVDILDITNPRKPVLINDTLDLFDATYQAQPAGLTEVFSHDMDVKKIDDRYVMSLNYWDGGYVLLDVTDPSPSGVTILAQSDYAEFDEERLARGHSISPEGNAHQSELSKDNDYLIGTDEDFGPYRPIAKITSGANTGTTFTAVQAADTPPITEDRTVVGETTYVGEACGPLAPASTPVALVERGTCFFQDKLDAITAAGYTAGIVFNNERPDCQALLTMLAEGEVPFMFVNRVVGLQLLNQGDLGPAACTTATPGGQGSAAVDITAVFDGWGYVRLFAADVGDGTPGSGSLDQIDTYAVPESQDPAFATGYGDLSVHEVAMDKTRNDIAYISYYAAGFRVVQFGDDGIQEIGAFIDQGGSNFWGVEVHKIGGKDYVLASDRDFGLYIFDTVSP